MSGGRLVVVDRGGRDVKRYTLASGLATLGSAPACDIRVMLATVCAHHATIAVHHSQTVIRNVGDGETMVNGKSVSVAALKHCDVITLGDRSLRWEYSAPNKRHQGSPGLPTIPVSSRGSRGARGLRRGSAGAAPAPRDRALQLAIEMTHRASMPASSGGKQVAIVQPQRRDNNEQPGGLSPAGARRSKPPAGDSEPRSPRITPKTVPSNTTKATLWIESRKSSPRRKAQAAAQVLPAVRRTMSARKSTPLRLTVLRKAQSAHKNRVVKIEAPLKIDHTKQAAIMLMAGHTPKSRLCTSGPSYVVKKQSPARRSPARKARPSARGSRLAGAGLTPKRTSTYCSARNSKRGSGTHSVSILEISDSTQNASRGTVSTRSTKNPQKSPLLPSPKKSALKDLTKKGNRKTESIKFDLSNLEGHQESEITSRLDSEGSASEDELALQCAEARGRPPSPRTTLNSRSSRMLERVGTSFTLSPSKTLTPNSPSSRKSARSSMIVQRALDNSQLSGCTSADQSADTVASAFQTRTLSPRSRNLEAYSIVDLVSMDSDISKSVYNSADSTDTTYGTPNTTRRHTRSTINPTLLGCSTPYLGPAGAAGAERTTRTSANTRRSKSLSTPDNKYVSVNSTKISRASRSRSRINDSDLLLLGDTEPDDSSPKTSRRPRTKPNVMDYSKSTATEPHGTCTPETRRSPVPVGTPVLSIQSLLDSSHDTSLRSQPSTAKGRTSNNYKRKTIGVDSEPKQRPASKCRSLGMSARQTVLRLSKDSSETSDKSEPGAPQPDNEAAVTPQSALKLVPEPVKNKHSTAKKPQSKRSIIDDLNRSDIVKHLFNSPVKRKLSHSMTHHLSDDDDIAPAGRRARDTAPAASDSISEHSGTFTPDRFVSPISTPTHSPDLSGIKRLFQANTPENDLADVRAVGSLLRPHRTRRSATNDLTNLTGLRIMFDNSPKSTRSDARGKEVLEAPRSGGGRRARGGTSPRNDLTDVRGVKKLFRKSPNNDLRNVSGVKRALRNSPRNDLTDVRGVRRMFRSRKSPASPHDVSGIEQLFNASTQSTRNSESLFDQLVGKPNIRNVYSKTFSTNLIQKRKSRAARSKTLHSSLDVITDNVEEWLERELQKRFRGHEPSTSKCRNASRSATKELHNLATSTVAGGEPFPASRTRTRTSSAVTKSASLIYSAHTLPIKKRSLVDLSTNAGKPRLPIKKRAVVHSTPVKGRVNITMNASELGRVSPIAAVDKTNVDHNTSSTGKRQNAPTPRSRSSKVTISQQTSIKLSPKASTSKAGPQASPASTAGPQPSPRSAARAPAPRVTRGRRSAAADNTRKRRSSLVIGKKAPLITPKPQITVETSPARRLTRATRHRKVETPKRTRVRTQTATVVVPKPSPKLKPQAQVEQKARRTRKNTAAAPQTESLKESQPRKTRGKQNEPKGKENKTDNVEKPKRGRRAAVEIEPPVSKRGRGKGKTVTKPDPKTQEKQPKTRGKKVQAETIQPEPITRRTRKNTQNISIEPTTRGRKAEPVHTEPKTRSRKVETQSSVQSEPVTRGRRTKAVDVTAVPQSRGRKRKTAAIEEVPPKVSKTQPRRGKKADLESENVIVKTRAAKDKVETNKEEIKTRGRAQKVEVEKATPAKATRAKKVVEATDSPAPDKRKRKTKAEASPAKGKKRSPADAKKARSEASARARARAGDASQVSTAAAGRSRRR